MLKFDGKKIIITSNLRKIMSNLIEETDYSGEIDIEFEVPIKKKYFNMYKRYL